MREELEIYGLDVEEDEVSDFVSDYCESTSCCDDTEVVSLDTNMTLNERLEQAKLRWLEKYSSTHEAADE